MKFCICFVFLALALSLAAATRCTTTNDCACGEICVAGKTPVDSCAPGSKCKCRAGCAVATNFIPVGVARNAFCNQCRCDSGSNGVPSCTRRAWCDLPADVSLYQRNTNCDWNVPRI